VAIETVFTVILNTAIYQVSMAVKIHHSGLQFDTGYSGRWLPKFWNTLFLTAVKMEAVCSFKMLLTIYQTM